MKQRNWEDAADFGGKSKCNLILDYKFMKRNIKTKNLGSSSEIICSEEAPCLLSGIGGVAKHISRYCGCTYHTMPT